MGAFVLVSDATGSARQWILKEIPMDRNRHSARTVLLTLHLALLCLVLCLPAGCEEAIVNSPQVAAGPEPAVTAASDLEAVAEAVENALGEMVFPSPEEAAEADPVVIVVEETAKADPAGPTEAIEVDPVGAVREILAESARPMAEEASEKEAAAELAKRIGLEYPIPAPSLELGADEPDPAADLDKMHIADVSLLAADAKPAQGYEEIQPAEQEFAASGTNEAQGEMPTQKAGSKGFAAKFVLTPCSAVAGFAGRHRFILGAAVVIIIAGLIVTKKKRSFSGAWRRWNSGR